MEIPKSVMLCDMVPIGRVQPAPRKLKLPGNHPRLDGNCLPIFSQNFALYYTIFTKLTSFKKQFIFFLNFLDFFQFFFRSTKNFHKKAATSDSKASLTGVEQRDASASNKSLINDLHEYVLF